MPKLLNFNSKRKATCFNIIQSKERFGKIYLNASMHVSIANPNLPRRKKRKTLSSESKHNSNMFSKCKLSSDCIKRKFPEIENRRGGFEGAPIAQLVENRVFMREVVSSG